MRTRVLQLFNEKSGQQIYKVEAYEYRLREYDGLQILPPGMYWKWVTTVMDFSEAGRIASNLSLQKPSIERVPGGIVVAEYGVDAKSDRDDQP